MIHGRNELRKQVREVKRRAFGAEEKERGQENALGEEGGERQQHF